MMILICKSRLSVPLRVRVYWNITYGGVLRVGCRKMEVLAKELQNISYISEEKQVDADDLSAAFVESEVREVRQGLPGKKPSLPTDVPYES